MLSFDLKSLLSGVGAVDPHGAGHGPVEGDAEGRKDAHVGGGDRVSPVAEAVR